MKLVVRLFLFSLIFTTTDVFTAFAVDVDINTAYYQAITEKGFDAMTVNDLSEKSYFEIEEPRCAYINISNIAKMPTKKKDDMHAWFECYDGNGNYFRKKVILNAQGNSSMSFPKKNFAADFL